MDSITQGLMGAVIAQLGFLQRIGKEAGWIAAGTAFEDLPDDWVCPDCGAPKSDFEPMD